MRGEIEERDRLPTLFGRTWVRDDGRRGGIGKPRLL